MNRVIKPVDENSSKPENKLPFKVKNFGLKMHLNMSNCGIRVDAGIIEWEGNYLHGKTICREVYTKKTKVRGWGKGEVIFYIDGDKKEHPSFKTVEDLLSHYGKSHPELIN